MSEAEGPTDEALAAVVTFLLALFVTLLSGDAVSTTAEEACIIFNMPRLLPHGERAKSGSAVTC